MPIGIRSDHPSGAAQLYQSPAAGSTNTLVLLKPGPVNCFSLVGENEDSSNDCYVQFFNAAATGDVTLGSTAPDYTVKLHNNTTLQLAFNFPLFYFNLGLVIAVTTTRAGSTAPSTLPHLKVYYM